MVTNNVSVNLVKIRIKMEYGRITFIKRPKSVSDTGRRPPFFEVVIVHSFLDQ